MRDDNVFDDWVDGYNIREHSVELMEAVIRAYGALRHVLSPTALTAVRKALREMDARACSGDYCSYDERLEETKDLDPSEFLAFTIGRIDNLNFEFGTFANALFCYASGGMVESATRDMPIENQRKQIADWLERGQNIVDAIPAELHPLPLFRIIVTGAQGRWSLDHGKPLHPDQVAALSAMVRYPGDTVISTYDRVRKTVQNLVSEASTKNDDGTTFKLNGDRMISANSALVWLRSQKPDYFPSPWQIPEALDSDEPERTIPSAFVPVTFAYQTIDEKPFTPAARCVEGYVIGKKSEVIDDYWMALEKLSTMAQPRFKHPDVPAYIGTLPCQEKWVRVPRAEIERQLTEQNAPPPLCAETAQFLSVIERDNRFRPHPKGHSAKLQRFECRNDKKTKAIALEPRKGTPNIYVAVNDLAGHPEIAVARTVAASPTGRNSNLNTIDQFKDTELAVIRPIDEQHLRRVLDALAG